MDYKIAICDDEIAQAEYLFTCVRSWLSKSGNSAVINTFPSAESFLFEYVEDKSYDILLLDIEMGNINGIELARRIRENNDSVQIIFITGFYDFISEGYDVCAVNYLMKPVSSEKLEDALGRATVNLKKTEKYLTVYFDRQTEYIALCDILYIEAQLQYVAIHTKNDIRRTKTTLSDTEKQLDGRFFRCQRSFIVNLAEVKVIKSDCVILKNGESIPISRGMSEKIGKAIISHF